MTRATQEKIWIKVLDEIFEDPLLAPRTPAYGSTSHEARQAGSLVGRVASGVLLPGSGSQTCPAHWVTLGKSLNLCLPGHTAGQTGIGLSPYLRHFFAV